MSRLVSVNVGLPRIIEWRGDSITTGIFKEPATGPLMIRTLHLDGDGQADLSVHGGATKAVYAYPLEHYDYWREELQETELPYGAFGENLTIEGLLEEDACVGDRFRVGEAELVVTGPRLPCYKLAAKFKRADLVKQFLASRRTGFYFSVAKEGVVDVGDGIERVHPDEHRVSIADIVRIYAFEKDDAETLRKAVRVEALPDGWRERFIKQLSGGD